MGDPLAKTFRLLATTGNLNAVDALIPALDARHERIRTSATSALIQRSSTRGQVEVIRRLNQLSPEARKVVLQHPTQMRTALKQCLVHGDDELRKNGLEIVRTTESFDQIATLLEMLHDEHNPLHESTAETIGSLANRLYEHCHPDKQSKATGTYLRNAQQIRHKVLTSLDQSCNQFAGLMHSRDVVEAVLVLGDVDNFAVTKVLSQACAECRELAGHLLGSSKHPGVMQLVLDFMSKNYPHPKAFEAIRNREDPEFVSHLLDWFPKRPSAQQARNFKQIESIKWIDPECVRLASVPRGLQQSLVSFVRATGLPNGQKVSVQEWLVRNGSPAGRLAAAEVLCLLDDDAVHNIVFDALDSPKPDVQAWATGQLRAQGIPEAFALLIERLDSPMAAVRNAARAELHSFNFDRMLGLFEHLDSEVCLRAGTLLRKINPDCVQDLCRELSNPIRQKRIRAARAAKTLGLHRLVIPPLLAMLEDSDTLVRRTGAEVLGDIPAVECVEALQHLLGDPNQRVRETAASSLKQIQRSAVSGQESGS